MKIHIDFESRSTVDLRKSGVYPYAEDPTTEILCMAYAIEDGPVELWTPDKPIPDEIVDLWADAEFHAHNAAFERVMWWLILSRRHGWPRPDREQFYCTAAAAAAMALPRSLEQCAQALGLPVQKDKEGHRIMLQMCKPRKARKGEDPNAIYWFEDEERKARLFDYCKQDVEVERAISSKLRPLSDYERRVYLLDQKINDRGVRLDIPLIKAAKEIVAEGMYRANSELTELTGGEVTSVTKTGQLTKWLGVRTDIDNVRKDTLRDLLDEDLPEEVRRVVELRTEAAKSSTAKLEAMLECACSDGRARGLLLYHGASTGRWSGRLIQPQNFPRTSYWRGSEQVQIEDVQKYIPAVLAGDYDAVDADHPALVVVSALLRGMLIPSPGHRFIAGDYGQIEARITAWIAEQEDLVEAFANDLKIYEEMACLIWPEKFSHAGEVPKGSDERQVSKNSVLGCGFGLGGAGFIAQVKVQSGIDLSEEEGDRIVGIYRERYPRIKEFWNVIDKTAMRAVRHPGKVYACGRNQSLRFVVLGGFLWCILPSGRTLAYAAPRIEEVETPWGAMRDAVTFLGVDSMTRSWQRQTAYGGLWTENVVQAMARDLIAAALLRLEDAGYNPVLSVHDEVVSDTPCGHGSVEEYENLMRTRPLWAAELPVAVEAWEGERYRK